MSEAVGKKWDGYDLQARYWPAFIAVLPGLLAFSAWFPSDKAFTGVFASTGVTAALGFLLVQVGRDGGKRRQKALFKEWGGAPTVRMLAYRHSELNAVTLTRYHQALNVLVPDLQLPTTRAEEKEGWTAAKQKYESASDYLRGATRDKQKFRLVYAENVNYGFRRNLWGAKRVAIGIASVALVATGGHVFVTLRSSGSLPGLDAASIILCVTMLALWLGHFTKEWVRVAADEYAAQLVSASELLVKDREASSVKV